MLRYLAEIERQRGRPFAVAFVLVVLLALGAFFLTFYQLMAIWAGVVLGWPV